MASRSTRRNGQLTAAKLVLTTGGQSYPGCGTTGDGYAWAAGFGHTIVPPRPSLVPVKIRSEWAKSLSGVTIPDVRVRVMEGDKIVSNSEVTDASRADRRGSLLFAHFGLSGPVVLDVSRVVSSHASPGRLSLECDFVPDVREEVLEKHMQDAASRQGKKQVAAIFAEWLPRRLSDALLAEAGLPAVAVVRGTQPCGTRAHRAGDQVDALSDHRAPWDSRKPKSRPAASRSRKSIRARCRASSFRICISPGKSWTSMDRSAATISRPRSAPAGWPDRKSETAPSHEPRAPSATKRRSTSRTCRRCGGRK